MSKPLPHVSDAHYHADRSSILEVFGKEESYTPSPKHNNSISQMYDGPILPTLTSLL